MIEQIESDLKSGKTLFKTPRGIKLKVNISASGSGGRYQAEIETPFFNTMIDTPSTVDYEGIHSFYSRLAHELVEIVRQVEFLKLNHPMNINSVYGNMGNGVRTGESAVICTSCKVGKSEYVEIMRRVYQRRTGLVSDQRGAM